jgi:hypothetical protein
MGDVFTRLMGGSCVCAVAHVYWMKWVDKWVWVTHVFTGWVGKWVGHTWMGGRVGG